MLILRELGPLDEKAFLEGMKLWVGESPHWYSFTWKEGMTYSEMLNILKKESKGEDLLPNRVQHTMLYGFLNDEIIGRVSIRHELNENLKKRGGHIGYAVAPKYRKQGYATEMVEQALRFCKKIGLKEILITCSDTNTPSWKIIEHFGGELENKVWDEEEQETIRRYWIKLIPV